MDPDQTAPSDQGPHCLSVRKIGLKSLQEYSADDINRRHFQMQFFLALYGLKANTGCQNNVASMSKQCDYHILCSLGTRSKFRQ